MPEVIVDTGPLVAMLVRTDDHHAWTIERLRELPPPFVTCEPVLAEAAHLVRRIPHGIERFVDLLHSDLLRVDLDLMAERAAIGRLLRKYADRPMSLADAASSGWPSSTSARRCSPPTATSPSTASTAGERSRSSPPTDPLSSASAPQPAGAFGRRGPRLLSVRDRSRHRP